MIHTPSEPQIEPVPNSSANQPLPNSNKRGTKAVAIVVFIVFFIIAYIFFRSLDTIKTGIPQKIAPSKTQGPSPTAPATNMNISSWKTYANKALNYSIQFPSDWTAEEFSNQKGASFNPANSPKGTLYGFISISRMGRIMFDDMPNPTFEEYVKKAGKEIENYNSLATMKKFVTSSGIIGYTTTWNVTSKGSGKEGISSPRTYFEIPDDNTASIQVELVDEKYSDIYNQMIATFAISKLEKKEKVSNPNLKTYDSSKLGISFTYLEKQDSQNITVTENGNKICVTYDANDTNCSKGQSVEVFQKGPGETLKAAITRLFLEGKDLTRCIVSISDPSNYPPTFVKGEIAFPEDKEVDMEKMAANTEYCSSDYAQTNGIRYFLEDKLHATKLLFFSIGQYGISSDENKTWQETIFFK